jgi:hypothetical protein
MYTNILNEKTIRNAVYLQVFNFILLIILFIYFSDFFKNNSTTNKFFHIGPTNNNIKVDIFGFNINTWNKWFTFIAIFIFIEIINTYSYKIYKNWYRNIIKDPKSKKTIINKKKTLIYISIWRFTTWFSKIINLTLIITTKQLQFTFPKFLSNLIISNIIDYEFIKNKIE